MAVEVVCWPADDVDGRTRLAWNCSFGDDHRKRSYSDGTTRKSRL